MNASAALLKAPSMSKAAAICAYGIQKTPKRFASGSSSPSRTVNTYSGESAIPTITSFRNRPFTNARDAIALAEPVRSAKRLYRDHLVGAFRARQSGRRAARCG